MIPSVAYKFIRIGIGSRADFTPQVSADLGAAFMLLTDAGQERRRDQVGDLLPGDDRQRHRRRRLGRVPVHQDASARASASTSGSTVCRRTRPTARRWWPAARPIATSSSAAASSWCSTASAARSPRTRRSRPRRAPGGGKTRARRRRGRRRQGELSDAHRARQSQTRNSEAVMPAPVRRLRPQPENGRSPENVPWTRQ